MTEQIFQVGDVVEHAIKGEKGVLKSSSCEGTLKIDWGKNKELRPSHVFSDGKFSPSDKYPSIRLIERPKKIIKKEAKVFISKDSMNYIKSGRCINSLISTKEGSDKIPVTITWEEEE